MDMAHGVGWLRYVQVAQFQCPDNNFERLYKQQNIAHPII